MRFLKRHKELLWFGLFAVVSAAYFSLQFLGLRHHLIHTPVDDVIPFVPAFIIPYVLWYFYVPGMMLFMCFKDREVFMRQVATLFTGAFICIAVSHCTRQGSTSGLTRRGTGCCSLCAG